MDGRLDGCGVQDEKDGVIGRGSGWEVGKNWMGNLMGHKVVRDIGRGMVIILAGKLHG